MKKQTTTIVALTMGLIATTGAALAYGNGFGMGLGNVGMVENTAITEAIEANDFDAWKTAMIEAYTSELTEERFNAIVEMHQSREAISQALENGDYTAWREAVENMQGPRIKDIITEENFETYVQLQQAEASGDFEAAQELREQLGLNAGMHGMDGPGGCRHMQEVAQV
jgi:hypothetical protein